MCVKMCRKGIVSYVISKLKSSEYNAFKGKPNSEDVEKLIKIADALAGNKVVSSCKPNSPIVTPAHMNPTLNLLFANKVISVGQNIVQKFKYIGQWVKKLF